MGFSRGAQSTEGGERKLYTGVGSFFVKGLNLNKKELGEMLGGKLGNASARVVIEEYLDGLPDLNLPSVESDVVLDDVRHHLIVGILKHYAHVLSYFVYVFIVARVVSENEYVARFRHEKPVQMFCKGGFPAAVRTHQRNEFPFVYRKGYSFKRLKRCGFVLFVSIRNVFDFNYFHNASMTVL